MLAGGGTWSRTSFRIRAVGEPVGALAFGGMPGPLLFPVVGAVLSGLEFRVETVWWEFVDTGGWGW